MECWLGVCSVEGRLASSVTWYESFELSCSIDVLIMLVFPPPPPTPPSYSLVSQEKRAVARAAKLATLRAGKAVGPKKSVAEKAVGKAFYKKMIVDSEYQGEDYEVFDKWLGNAQ